MSGQENPDYRRLVRDALLKWQSDCSEAFQVWNLETVRTLALVNSAGLAGVSAIYASESAAKATLGSYPAAACFALGLISALVNMYANSQGHIWRQREIMRRIRAFDAQTLQPQDALADTTTGAWPFRIAEGSGWLTALFFAGGAWPFVKPAFISILVALN